MGSKRYKPTRYYMYNRIQEFFNKYNHKLGKCLLIGDSIKGVGDDKVLIKNTAIVDMLPEQSVVLAPTYPDVDIHEMPYKDNSFDYVIADQVLEHVRYPWIAVEEAKRVLKSGGWLILTTCLMNYVHGVPEDYFRFTPDGIRVLCEGFSIIEQAEGYGNPNFITKIMNNKYQTPVVPESKLANEVTSNNDHTNLYLVWIIAQK